MKINFLLPHLKIAGGVRIGLNYAQLLSEMGHDVTVITITKVTWRRVLSNAIRYKIKWYKGFKPKVLKVDSFSEDNIPDADIIIGCDFASSDDMNKYSSKKGKKIQFIMHDERLYHGKKEEVEKSYSFKNNKITISKWLQGVIKTDFNQDSLHLLTPVDYNLFHKVDIKKNKDEVRILMLHHIYDWKGVKEGMEAIEYIKSKYKNIKLVLFGVRSEKPDIDCDEYHYNMSQDKLAGLYAGCDIFLCPSWYEGLGMPAMEAMACGSAVVTFDTGGSRDYAFDGKTAFVAKHRDIEDLKKKLELAVTDVKLRQEIAERGYKFVTEDIDNWEESAKKLENFMNNV